MGKKSLEEKIERLEKEIQRLKDIHEIQNLMGRYEYLHTSAGGDYKLPDLLWAKKTPGASAELGNWGVYEGFEGVKKIYDATGKGSEIPGQMFMHTLTTPVIEVADDGKTAKGVWISPGHETIRPRYKRDEKPVPHWAWIKYGIDFVKEDGEWKIWHLHVYGIFHTPYDTSWVDVPPYVAAPEQRRVIPFPKPDKPTTYHWLYNQTALTEMVPKPPEPYETFDETFRY